jgi:hypothetical protein
MKKRADSNALMYSVGEVCALYSVRLFRIQSRTFTVVGAAGRTRPMFIGQWTDDNGTVHYKGMADLLARPKIEVHMPHALDPAIVTVPLWIECKSGDDKLSADQEAFRHHVTNNGEFHITIKDDLRPLMQWFDEHGLKQGAYRR